jgi:colicin import membrane protein
MALPATRPDHSLDAALPQPVEALFRPVRQPGGEVLVEKLPLTLDVLLHPQEEDQVAQSKPHQRRLGQLADQLVRFYESRTSNLSVYSDLMILWKQVGERDVAPDVCLIKDVRDPGAINRSFDPVVEGASPCLVFEVVSSSTADMVKKDEESNPPLFERRGVEDLILVYPPDPGAGEVLRIAARRLRGGGYRANPAGPEGWIKLRSVGLRIKVSGDQLVIEDVASGERLLTSIEEQHGRIEAERGRAQAERRCGQEAEARRAAEEAQGRAQEQNKEMLAELERLRARG